MTADQRAAFAACVAHVLDIGPDRVPVPGGPDPFVGWRGWLATRGFGLVPVDRPARFTWPGFWIARIRSGERPERWVVMFGVPSGPVFDPAGELDGGEAGVEAGYVIAPLEVSPPRLASGAHEGPAVVEAIYVAETAAASMQPRRAVEAHVEGLAGDRYARGAGTFSNPAATGTALTLIEAEALDGVVLPGGARLPYDEARRNVVTRGVALNDLVGRRFTIGGVECYGQRLCEPCAHWQRLTRPGVLRPFVHRGGLRADILVAGRLHVGDAIEPA